VLSELADVGAVDLQRFVGAERGVMEVDPDDIAS